MKHIITAKNTTVTDGIRSYVEKRFSKFDKYASEDICVYTKIEVKDNGNRHKVEVTIPFGKQTLRAEANDTDMYAAIDNVERTMARLLRKRKEKITEHRQKPITEPIGAEDANNEYEISRVKTHEMLAMTAQEACEAMEMVGHPFYAYFDVDKDAVCVVYRRENDTYGQLVYQEV